MEKKAQSENSYDYTFGKSKASKVLRELLSNDKKLLSKISSSWQKYCLGIQQIKKMDTKHQKVFGLLWRNYFLETEIQMPENIRTHYNCVICATYREIGKKNETVHSD